MKAGKAPAGSKKRRLTLRRLVSALLLLGLVAAFTRPGRRAVRGAARWADNRVENFAEPESELYARCFAPMLDRLYRRVALDASAELRGKNNRRPLVVDLGCGTGELVVELSRAMREARIMGVDLSPSMLLWANRHATSDGRIKFAVADAANLPFDDESVDLIVSTLSLHHWQDPAAVFEEIDRVLRPGGCALLYDPSLLSMDRGEMTAATAQAGIDPARIATSRVRGFVLGRLFVRFRIQAA